MNPATRRAGWHAAWPGSHDDPPAALDDFRHALRLNPRSRAARQNIAHVLSERMNKTVEAIDVLDELLELAPEDPAVWVARGVLRARQGDRSAAIRDAQHALRLEAAVAMSIRSDIKPAASMP